MAVRRLQRRLGMPCYDPETQTIVAMPDDDACYAPEEVEMICPAPYPIEATGGGDGSEPFHGMYDHGHREWFDRKQSVTMVDPQDADPERYPGAVTGYRDLGEMVDMAVHEVGANCLHELTVVDGGAPGVVEVGDQRINVQATREDPEVQAALARLKAEMCYDGHVVFEKPGIGIHGAPNNTLRSLAESIYRPVTGRIDHDHSVQCYLPMLDEHGNESQRCEYLDY